MLCEERNKNNNQTAHMVIDKCVGELCYVLELLERNAKYGQGENSRQGNRYTKKRLPQGMVLVPNKKRVL